MNLRIYYSDGNTDCRVLDAGYLYIMPCHLNISQIITPNGGSVTICSDTQEKTNMMPSAVKPERTDPEAGREFIEGIRKGLKDYAEGRYEVFEDADELLDELLGQ